MTLSDWTITAVMFWLACFSILLFLFQYFNKKKKPKIWVVKQAFFWSLISTIFFFAVGLFFIVEFENKSLELIKEIKKKSEEDHIEIKKQTRLLEEMQRIDKTNYKTLLQKYPLGYALFAFEEGDENVLMCINRLYDRFEMNWERAKIVELTKDRISIRPPTLVDKETGAILVDYESSDLYEKNMPERASLLAVGAFGINRKVGAKSAKMYFPSATFSFELLFDNSKEIILVMGFEDSKNNIELEESKSTLLQTMQSLEAQRERILRKYPLGYSLFAVIDEGIDSGILMDPRSEVLTLKSEHPLCVRYNIDWNNAEVALFGDLIYFMKGPVLYDNESGISLETYHDESFLRKNGIISDKLVCSNVRLVFEIIIDFHNGALCILGLKEDTSEDEPAKK